MKNYNTLYCPDDPDDAETMGARKRGRSQSIKMMAALNLSTILLREDMITAIHRTIIIVLVVCAFLEILQVMGEGNSYQYNQYSSGYSDRDAQHQSVMMQSQAQPSQSMQQHLVQQQQQIMRQQKLI